ncbi:MAG TPA: hypothetical protein PLZ32_17560 [Saprospiraceae bacterium]|nr:hypothetical protein [Saprospiraceae bacterium]
MKDDLKKLEDRGWNEMFTLLEKELPTSKKRRMAIWWWASGIAATIIVGSFLLFNNDTSLPHSDQLVVVKLDQPQTNTPASNSLNEDNDAENPELIATAEIAIESSDVAQPQTSAKISARKTKAIALASNENYSNIPPNNEGTMTSDFLAKTTISSAATTLVQPSLNTDKLENSTTITSSVEGIEKIQSQSTKIGSNQNEIITQNAQIVALLNSREISLANNIPTIFPLIKPLQGIEIHGGFVGGVQALASLNNIGQFETSIGLGYRKILNGQFSIKAGGSLGLTNLDLAYESVNEFNDPNSPLMDKEATNVYQNTNNFSSSKSGRVASKYIVNAHLGVGYAFNNKFLLETTGGIRRHLEKSRANEAPNSLTSGNNTPTPQKSNLELKSHYFQTLDLHYFVNHALNVKASYMLTGQPINTGFIIDHKIGKVNHFAGIGLE